MHWRDDLGVWLVQRAAAVCLFREAREAADGCRLQQELRSQRQREHAGRECERVVVAQKRQRNPGNAAAESRLPADDVFPS